VRLTVIYNPKAGETGWTRDHIAEPLRAAGHEPRMVSAKEDWQPEVKKRADAVVAAGGDGTIQKVALALAGSDTPLCMVPIGTANNIATSFGHVAGQDPFARAAHWGKKEKAMSVWCAGTGKDGVPFVEVIGAGAFARLLQANRSKKKRPPLVNVMGSRKGLLQEVLEGPVEEMTLRIDGERIEGEFVLVAGMPLTSFGPMVKLAPDQKPGSETLTVAGVRSEQREAFARWLLNGESDPSAFHIGSARQLQLTLEGPVQLDDHMLEKNGEKSRTVTVGVGKRSVRVFV
jgi:diacylglycerol kinase (ATP)